MCEIRIFLCQGRWSLQSHNWFNLSVCWIGLILYKYLHIFFGIEMETLFSLLYYWDLCSLQISLIGSNFKTVENNNIHLHVSSRIVANISESSLLLSQ